VIENNLSDVLWAVALFFLNPILATSLIAAVLLGYFRVKRERRNFRVRLLPGITELKRLFSESWLYGLVLSVVITGVGLIVDPGWLVLYCVASLIVLISFNYKLASPIYFAATAFFVLFIADRYAGTFSYRGWTPPEFTDLLGSLAITISIIAGLLLIAEGLLIGRHGARDASPFYKETNRGLRAVVFKAKRLWVLPVLFLVPGDMITAYVPYWPQFTFGEASFAFIPVPIIIGISQVARSMYAEDLLPKIGRSVAVLGLIVAIVGILGLWLPMLGWTALVIGVVGRVLLSVVVSVQQRKEAFIAVPRSTGVVIVGIIPGSPGEKMGLVPGECIRAVNGQVVSNEKELYDAIQINAAHCRLQVDGRDGEVRLMQQVIYHHDHHRLGLLVVR